MFEYNDLEVIQEDRSIIWISMIYDSFEVLIPKKSAAKILGFDYQKNEELIDYEEKAEGDYISFPTINGIPEDDFIFNDEEIIKLINNDIILFILEA
jgi:hypothetical protein